MRERRMSRRDVDIQFNLWAATAIRGSDPDIDRFATEGVVFENAYTEGLPTVPCRRPCSPGATPCR
ncbi:MAG: hypothetical protein ACLT2T_09370 [Bilophila wadsworthia]